MPARKAKFSESQMVIQWLRDNRESNWFDEKVIDYEKCEIIVAPDDKPTTCLPIYLGLMLDSLGHDKESKPGERLAASLECLQGAVIRAKQLGINELFYVASDQKVDKRMEQLGFKPVWCYRAKI